MELQNKLPSLQSTALFFFAHQDDEVGVFQKIIDEQSKGQRVICVYMTDGGKSMLVRNRESLVVLGELGVPEKDVIFAGQVLSIPDGDLHEHLETAADWIIKWLMNSPVVSAIYLPAWEGGHPDHDALHAIGVIVAEKFKLLGVTKQFPLYNGYNCEGPFFRVMKPLEMNGEVELIKVTWSNRLRFLRYCLSYPSQKITWIGLFPFFLCHYLFYGTQMLQAVSSDRIGQRPHNGRLYYERRKFSTWEKISNRLSEYKQ